MIDLSGFSNRRACKIARRFGHRDGKNGRDAAPELVLARTIRTRPLFDPEHIPQHARWEDEQHVLPQEEVWAQELDAVEKERTKHVSRGLFRLFVIGLGVAEFLAMAQLLKGLGLENPERAVVAAAASCILFVFIGWAAKGVEQ